MASANILVPLFNHSIYLTTGVRFFVTPTLIDRTAIDYALATRKPNGVYIALYPVCILSPRLSTERRGAGWMSYIQYTYLSNGTWLIGFVMENTEHYSNSIHISSSAQPHQQMGMSRVVY